LSEEVCGQKLQEALNKGNALMNESGEPLFAFRFHQFLAAGGTVYSTLEPSADRQLRPLAVLSRVTPSLKVMGLRRTRRPSSSSSPKVCSIHAASGLRVKPSRPTGTSTAAPKAGPSCHL
jgi:hypothetical protein